MNRSEVEQFIQSEFGGIILDYPWESYPNYAVFRHADSRKWFALVASAQYATLNINNPGEVNFINLKCDPDLVETITREPGILPAYHMNKRHWITILLDGSCPADRVKSLIALSFQLTAKAKHDILSPTS